jgi:S1-C subfamily serine protease
MLTFFTPAAARFLVVLLSAVFFGSTVVADEASLNGLESGLTDLVYRLSRSVVTVEAARRLPTSRYGSTVDETYQKEMTTGIVVDSCGLILVAARPVLGYDRLTVRYESRAVAAELVAVDYQTELALLRATQPGGYAPELDTRHACAGQVIIALGHAFGFRSSPALGFCTGLRDDGVAQFSIPSLGNRLGSGVFDLGGHLLGIVTEVMAREPALVMAVPAHEIPGIVNYLLNQGDRQSGFAGITSQEIEISPGLVLPRADVIPASVGSQADTIERGVVVTLVLPASPAARAGLVVGDLIYAVDRMPVNSAAGLASLVRQSLPGTQVQLELLRQNRYLNVPLVIGRKSLNLDPGTSAARSSTDQSRLVDSLRQALEAMRNQLNRLENRLDALD